MGDAMRPAGLYMPRGEGILHAEALNILVGTGGGNESRTVNNTQVVSAHGNNMALRPQTVCHKNLHLTRLNSDVALRLTRRLHNSAFELRITCGVQPLPGISNNLCRLPLCIRTVRTKPI